MTYIISHFWLWLLPIFIAGIATAILTRQAEAKGKVAPWLIWCGLAFAAGADGSARRAAWPRWRLA